MFKSARVKQEYLQLPMKNPELFLIFASAFYFSMLNFKKPLLITHIFRTKEEQNLIYGSNENYVKNPWSSVHELWRGLDCRNASHTPAEQKQLVEFINDKFQYDPTRPDKKTLISHDVGRGSHFHFQTLRAI